VRTCLSTLSRLSFDRDSSRICITLLQQAAAERHNVS
jgi:hypothetical protein